MTPRTDTFDLGAMRLSSGEGRRLDLGVALDPFDMGGETYAIPTPVVPVHLDISRTMGDGYALRLSFETTVNGPCMRCLEPAAPVFPVTAREVSLPGEGDELESPYVQNGVLALGAWARDALALTLPAQLLCRPDCAGLCPVCGADLNGVDAGHVHEREPDPRWSKLSELRFD
jgi:uncharacterized protein